MLTKQEIISSCYKKICAYSSLVICGRSLPFLLNIQREYIQEKLKQLKHSHSWTTGTVKFVCYFVLHAFFFHLIFSPNSFFSTHAIQDKAVETGAIRQQNRACFIESHSVLFLAIPSDRNLSTMATILFQKGWEPKTSLQSLKWTDES